MAVLNYIQKMWQLAMNGDVQGIWFWGALYFLLLCAYSLIYQLRTRRWPSTQGELASLGIEKSGATTRVKSDQEYVSNSLYRYRVDGEEYEGVRISPWVFVASHNVQTVLKKQLESVQRESDGRVKVFYNPKNPRKSFLILPGPAGIAVTAVLGLCPMLLYWMKFHR